MYLFSIEEYRENLENGANEAKGTTSILCEFINFARRRINLTITVWTLNLNPPAYE